MTDSDSKTCGSCGAEVSDHAKVCPACYIPIDEPKPKLWIGVIFLIVVFVLIMVIPFTNLYFHYFVDREPLYERTEGLALAYLPEEVAVLRESANRGSSFAMRQLFSQVFRTSRKDRDGAMDDARSSGWSDRASEQENGTEDLVDAISKLSSALEPSDYVEAYIYFAVAASQLVGHQRDVAAYARDLVADGLSPEDFSTVQRLAQECIEKGLHLRLFDAEGNFSEPCRPNLMIEEALPALKRLQRQPFFNFYPTDSVEPSTSQR